MTTNVDTDLDSSKKLMPSLGNPALRIGFVHQEDVPGLITTFPVAMSSNSASTLGQQQPCSPEGALHQRPTKPVEWRVHLASVKVRFYALISLQLTTSDAEPNLSTNRV
jgi:hypothetical protein